MHSQFVIFSSTRLCKFFIAAQDTATGVILDLQVDVINVIFQIVFLLESLCAAFNLAGKHSVVSVVMFLNTVCASFESLVADETNFFLEIKTVKMKSCFRFTSCDITND